ncbi:MAG: hypothetical protein LUH21_04100 [Clostridiales bacterium]|nr:hypothetical protein [Clostridiales bacterium]
MDKETKYTTYELLISQNLLDSLRDLLYEKEDEGEDINDFIIKAIVQRFNRKNNLFKGKMGVDGWIDD